MPLVCRKRWSSSSKNGAWIFLVFFWIPIVILTGGGNGPWSGDLHQTEIVDCFLTELELLQVRTFVWNWCSWMCFEIPGC